MSLFAGLMSGTSLDGIDGVVVDWPDDDLPSLQVKAHVHHAFDAALRSELLALNASGTDELERAARAGIGLAHAYAAVVQALLRESGLRDKQLRAVGAHGQTVRHRPEGGIL